MRLHFTKMQGIGNDFVVIDAVSKKITLSTAQLKQIADRHLGIGCDQILLVEKAIKPNVDFRYRIFNADGGEVEQCGNGARCFVRFVVDKDLTQKHEITVETAAGIISLKLLESGEVAVNMGAPQFNPEKIPFLTDVQQTHYTLPLKDCELQISAVSMGNPHAVLLVDNTEAANVSGIGPQVESHPKFPQRVNVGFMQIINSHEINLRVYERGSGETLGCGTGACAAVVTGIQLSLLQSPVLVNMRGGQLTIEWAGENQAVMMSGPAKVVFEGEIDI